MSKRIALCLSGIVGGTKGPDGSGDLVDMNTIYNQCSKHILSKNNVDIFIHFSVYIVAFAIFTFMFT